MSDDNKTIIKLTMEGHGVAGLQDPFVLSAGVASSQPKLRQVKDVLRRLRDNFDEDVIRMLHHLHEEDMKQSGMVTPSEPSSQSGTTRQP